MTTSRHCIKESDKEQERMEVKQNEQKEREMEQQLDHSMEAGDYGTKEPVVTAQPYFTFGIIADIQYADMDDGYNFMKTRKRYYRNSLILLQNAVYEWSTESVKPIFILQLGDIIDGFNTKNNGSETSLAKVLLEIEKIKILCHHIWGNHDFYNFSRKYLQHSKLNTKPLDRCTGQLDMTSQSSQSEEETFYAYHFSPHPKFRIVLIDSYDLSVLGRDPSHTKYKKSMQMLKENNHNEDLNSPEGLKKPYFVQFNGGISASQLNWINHVLTSSDEKEEKVIVAGHLPIHPAAADTMCLMWNYQEVLSVIQSHPCVVGYFAGHDHDGGYCVDDCGIHHITFKGVIETHPGMQAFGTMYMYEDRMVLKGRGLAINGSLHHRNRL